MDAERDFLSDADKALLDREFQLTADADLGELATHLPDGCELREILFQYDETPPGGKAGGHKPNLECGFTHGARHWKGYIVEIADGRKTRIGSKCGETHLGAKFGTSENLFNAAVDRKYYLLRLIELRRALPVALEDMASLIESDAVRGFDAYMDQMRRQFGKLSQQLAQTIRENQGRLISMRMVRDEAEEEEVAKRQWADLFEEYEYAATSRERKDAVADIKELFKSLPPIMKPKPLDIGPCSGSAMLEPAALTPAHLLRKAHNQIKEYADLAMKRMSGEWTTSDLAAMIKGLRSALHTIDVSRDRLNELKAFSSPANIERLARWANENAEFDEAIGQDFVGEGRTLVAKMGRDRIARLDPPREVDLPPTANIDRIREITS